MTLRQVRHEIETLLSAAYESGALSEVVEALIEPIANAVTEEGVLRGLQVWVEEQCGTEDPVAEDMAHRVSMELDRTMTKIAEIRG